MFLDRDAVQAEVHSPLWQAGLYRPPGRDVILDPAKLVRGLARVCEERGVAIHEHTRVTRGRAAGGRRRGPDRRRRDASTPTTSSSRRRPTRAGCAGSSSQFVPVYDYVLVSEPLTPDQRASIGWARRQGMSDANNQFHYFRLTADDRILWGGYDAVYYRGNGVGPQFDRRPATFDEARGALPARRSRSSRTCASRTAGAARSTRRRGSRSRSARRWAGG